MKVYVDLGAYDGDTIRLFMRKRTLNPKEFDIYAFEPNPNMWLDLTALPFKNIKEISNKAAWVNNGEYPFALDTNDLAYGSTLMKSKTSIWDQFDKIDVECFDFSEWVKQFSDDYLIVKMDVEGAEFPILEKMLQDGTAKFMDELWVEMHPNKVQAYTSTDSNELIQRIRDEGVEVVLWH